jgi:hypothetical protein
MPTSLTAAGIYATTAAAAATAFAMSQSISSLVSPERAHPKKDRLDSRIKPSRLISDRPFDPKEALTRRNFSTTLRPANQSFFDPKALTRGFLAISGFTQSVLLPLIGVAYLIRWIQRRQQIDTTSIRIAVATKFWLEDAATRIAIHNYIKTGHLQDQATREKILTSLYIDPCDRVCDLLEKVLENQLANRRIAGACRLILQAVAGSIEDLQLAKKDIKIAVMRNHPDKNLHVKWSKPSRQKEAASILRLLLLAKRILQNDFITEEIATDEKRRQNLFS